MRWSSSPGCAPPGVLVRERFSEVNPGEVTGYAVSLRGCTGTDGAPRWYGGGRLHDSLTLPRLRPGGPAASSGRRSVPGRSGSLPRNAPRSTGTRRGRPPPRRSTCAAAPPVIRVDGADAAWAAADTLHAAARATGSRVLRCAADGYDRAARAPYGRIPRRTRQGDRLRAAARLLAMTGQAAGDGTGQAGALAANLVALADAVAGLREAQAHAAQAAAARQAAEQLSCRVQPGPAAGATSRAHPSGARPGGAAERAQADFPLPLAEVVTAAAAQGSAVARSRPQVAQPPARAKPAR